MKALLSKIKNDDIRKGVQTITDKYSFIYDYYLCSFSGRYHAQEPNLLAHVKRCVYFANHLLDEFDASDLDRDVVIAACILHDIGKLFCAWNPQITPIHHKNIVKSLFNELHVQYHKNTGWFQHQDLQQAHPLLSSLIVSVHPFKYSRDVQDLIEVHMSHWAKKICRQPDNLLHYIMCSADYLASRDIKIDKELL